MDTLFNNTYRNKKVLVTGNTGFKGSWLSAWLLEMGAKVFGISNDIPTQPSHFEAARLRERIVHYEADIRDIDEMLRIINEVQPDFVFHLAAQPLVRLSYKQPLQTLHSNVLGTAHVLEALRHMVNPCYAVIITSDKCYDNAEWIWGYRENDRLGGKDPYSASKGAAELVIRTYYHSYFSKEHPVQVAVGRAGNVIGGGDWALDRIVPDCMNAWAQKNTVKIRNPHATRPWQHVLEPLSGYLALGAQLSVDENLNGETFNFGPPAHQDHSVKDLIEEMQRHWQNVQWEDVSQTTDTVYEAGLLKLCCDKALGMLQWQPVLNFEKTAEMTVAWYRQFYQTLKEDIYPYTAQQIQSYIETARLIGRHWTI
ncbi:MAG: CDP-glucose 4,6-dehydratase [Desulfamplus sp.]|nr:CDP-glucose 4,6-dehydratase [Desulfamplus sp.]